jgi:hypothetical protein
MKGDSRSLYVAGSFNDSGGRPSKIAEAVYMGAEPPNCDYINGGSFGKIRGTLDKIRDYRLIFWFADVPNEKPKLIQEIKQKNSACVLVTSKRNVDGKYNFQDLLYHALGIKSNLVVEITREKDRYKGRVLDPLANVFLDSTEDFDLVGRVLGKRSAELMGYTRIPSERVGDRIEIPDEREFFELIAKYADMFHNHIHARPEAANRFFGNASFRCERGFPSVKSGGKIFVSRRNIDKRHIDKEGFVAVEGSLPVNFFGDSKPSVDTPIQIRLYNMYPSICYMLHSHSYIDGAPRTERVVPCGAIEEAEEIIKLFQDWSEADFSVNLKGHGSLVLTGRIDGLMEIPFVPRDMPEVHEDYAENL